MRRISIALGIILGALGINRAEEDVLLKNGTRYGAYAGPVVRFSPANSNPGMWFGGRAGMIFNSTYAIGIEGYGLTSSIKADHPDTADLMIGIWGLVFEGILFSDRTFHGTGSLLLGTGEIGFGHGSGMGMNMWYGGAHSMRSAFVVEPQVNLEVNVAPFFRLCPGLSYRWFSGNVPAVNSTSDVSSVSFNLLFKFGRF